MKIRLLLIVAVVCVVAAVMYMNGSLMVPGSNQAVVFTSSPLVQDVTAQAVKSSIPPTLSSDWIPSTCSLNDRARGMTYRLPWAYFGAAPGIDGDPHLGAQLLHCPDGYRVLYWDIRYTQQGKLVDPYHELSGVASFSCWYEQHRYLAVTVGVHDPYLGAEQVWADDWGRDAPMFGNASLMAGAVDMKSLNRDCTAS